MDNKEKKVSKVQSSKKLKYGTSALVFTVVFVAFIILVNVLISYIDHSKGGLYVDLTSENLYEVSEASVKALDGVDIPVEIIFCQDRDKVNDESVLVHTKMLAESYEKNFDNVSVLYKDKLRDVAYFNEHKFQKTSDDVISYLSIIVYCPSTGLSKIYSWENMYKFTEDGMAFAFDGENKITSAILSVARNEENMLRAGLVTGHGEDNNHSVQHFLEDFGYAVSAVDLKTIEMEELAKFDILLVCNPKVDFIGMQKEELAAPDIAEEETADAAAAKEVETKQNVQAPAANETSKIYDYVTDHFGNVFFFFSPSYANMPEIYELLEDRFGVVMNNFCTVWDDGSVIVGNSNNPEDLRFQGLYSKEAGTDGYKLHKGISEIDYYGEAPKVVFGESCFLSIAKSQVDAFTVSPVIVASDSAKVYLGMQAEAVPSIPLMTLSKYTKLVGDHDKSGNVIVCGSTAFLDELNDPAYPNADLFKHTLINMGNDKIITDIEWKVLDEVEIVQTQEETNAMMRNLGIIIPVIIVIIGAIVFIKRKYL